MPAPLAPLASGAAPVVVYEPQNSCDPAPKPGAVRIARIITDTYGAGQRTWIPRGCDVGPTSEHKEGRAVDWMVSVRDRQERAQAEAFLAWLLGPDQSGQPGGHARQLGVMYIGWHDRIWRGYDPARGWQELKGCFAKTDAKYDNYCHRNHIHISLTRWGASGTDVGTAPAPLDPVPPAPEAPLDDTPLTEGDGPQESTVTGQPVPDNDLFRAIGAELGYRSGSDGALRPRETRTVTLAPIPANATTALVSVTTREAAASSRLRVGLIGRKGNAVALRVPESSSRTSVLSVPVSEGQVQIRAGKSRMQVRIDVLGYAVDDGVYPAVGSAQTRLVAQRFVPDRISSIRVRGRGAVPAARTKVTAVILRVTATGRGAEGRFAAYPVGGQDLGTASAAVPASGSRTSILVADLGKRGRVAMTSSVRAQVTVDVIGYVRR